MISRFSVTLAASVIALLSATVPSEADPDSKQEAAFPIYDVAGFCSKNSTDKLCEHDQQQGYDQARVYWNAVNEAAKLECLSYASPDREMSMLYLSLRTCLKEQLSQEQMRQEYSADQQKFHY